MVGQVRDERLPAVSMSLADFYFLLFWLASSAVLYGISIGIIELTSEITETELVRPRLRMVFAGAGGFAIAWYGASTLSTVPADFLANWIPSLLLPVSTIFLSILLSIFAYDLFRHWARRSKSHTRGFVLTLGVIMVPVVIFSYGLVIVVQKAGLDLNQLLFTSGVLGIVLGLALQDTLSSVFARYALLADESIVEGDMVVLDDGRICRIDYIGYRTTKMYYVKEHSVVFVPNSNLASATITNISRPNVALRVTLPIGVSYDSKVDIGKVSEVLETISRENPHVLVRLDQKLAIIEGQIESIKEKAESTEADQKAHLQEEVQNYERLLRRLELESELDDYIDNLFAQLTEESDGTILYRLIQRERGLIRRSNKPIRDELKVMLGSGRRHQKIMGELELKMTEWTNAEDPWAWDEDYESEYFKRSQKRTEWTFELKRNNFLDSMSEGNADEVREKCVSFAKYLREEFKPKITSEQNPMARFAQFDTSSVDLTLDFYVDDIRLNRYWRREIVMREIATEVKRRFDVLGIEIPFPQTDVHIRDALKMTSPEEKRRGERT